MRISSKIWLLTAVIGSALGATHVARAEEMTPVVNNVFIPREEITAESMAAREAELKNEFTELSKLEQSYYFSYQDLKLQWKDPDELRDRLNTFIEELSPEDRTALDAGKLDQFSPIAFEKKSRLLFEMDQWFISHSAHHALIDQLNLEKFNYFIKQGRFYSDLSYLLLSQQREEIRDGLFRKLTDAHEEIVAAHQNFLANLDKYGTPKDTFRLAAIRDTFKAMKNYFAIVNRINQTPAERLDAIKKKIAAFPEKFWENLKLLSLAPDAVKLGKDILFNDGGKINNTVNDIFLKAARLKGYDVDVVGLRNLDILGKKREEKTINIVAKVHRGPVLDNMVLASLHLKDYVFVTSFGSIIPKFFSNRLKDNPGIAFVGPGFPGGVDTLVNKATQNPEHIMVNYAEGSIGDMGETRPIATKFSTAVIPALRKAGYKVNVIPVTSQAASFLKQDIGPEMLFGKIIGARVHAPITDSMITFLEATGRLDKLGILIRSTWLSELQTQSNKRGNLIEGALSLRGLEKMVIKYMNVHYSENPFCDVDLLQK